MADNPVDNLRVPPQNLEAEQALLGSILMEPGSLDRIVSLVTHGSFYKSAHNAIFKAMLDLQNQGEPIDVVTLTNRITKEGQLEKVGGAYYLTGLLESLPSAANIEYYAEIVREKHILREVISAGNQLAADAFDGEGDPGQILDLAEQRLFDLQRHAAHQQSKDIDSILKDALAKLDRRHSADKKGAYSGIPSGFKDLDDMTDGFQKSDLVILAGRPSMGKTALALNIASNAALMDPGHRIGVFSMEMSNYQIAMRFITSEGEIDSLKVRKGTLSKRDWPRVSKAAAKLSKAPIFIDDTAGMDILELRSRIRRFKSDFDVDMVIIDYMQLISGKGRTESRQQEMSDISRSLKGLARELDIAVMGLSQLSRAPEQRPGKEKRPIMSDLRESGAIEQDADVILFLYRPIVYSRNPDDEGRAEVIIAKQRNGPTGTVILSFRSDYTKFGLYTSDAVFAELPVGEEEPF